MERTILLKYLKLS